jgi:hypothetical protein
MSEELKIPEQVVAFDVGQIGNYYGSLTVMVDNGQAYWSIEDYRGHTWEKIPDYLYFALVKFKGESK